MNAGHGLMHREAEVAIVGGGLVGAAVAYGLMRSGLRVALLDEGDTAVRASRGNFSLVWVQAKGLGMPAYARWTVQSSNEWFDFSAELKHVTGLDVLYERPGGFFVALSDAELEARSQLLKRFHNQSGGHDSQVEMVDRAMMEKHLPGLGPDVVGGSYSPLDGHVNSLRLLRALHAALVAGGAQNLSAHPVSSIERRDGIFHLTTPRGPVRAAKVVLAAGNANRFLAPMVGLSAPMVPERGQVLVTERVQPFLRHPIVTLRQTDEGTVMIGDSREEGHDPTGIDLGINSVMANRAVRTFPLLGRVNVVRSWRAVRVMPADGFPIYDQSTSHPGAYVVTCHSGVTLAAMHALVLAPMIAAGRLDDEVVGAFSARRFDVPKVA